MRRVLKDLAGVNRDLAFWKRRLSEGSHGRFLLLSRGPASFVRSLSAALHRHTPHRLEGGRGAKELSAADKIERRVRSHVVEPRHQRSLALLLCLLHREVPIRAWDCDQAVALDTLQVVCRMTRGRVGTLALLPLMVVSGRPRTIVRFGVQHADHRAADGAAAAGLRRCDPEQAGGGALSRRPGPAEQLTPCRSV